MKIKLTSREIAERNGVTQRTAFRWLKDGDGRCFDEIAPESAADRDRRESDATLKKILDDVASVSERLSRWAIVYDDSPRIGVIEPLQKKVLRLVDDIQKASGVYPEVDWNETASE